MKTDLEKDGFKLHASCNVGVGPPSYATSNINL